MAGQEPVQNPSVTGGSGNLYEFHVGAMFLGYLLVRGIPAVFRNCQVTAVSFQTSRIGWATDDLLVTCTTEQLKCRKLVIQAKSTFNVRESSSGFKKTFQGFWKDFRKVGLFDREYDSFVLVTLPGSGVRVSELGQLLECARNSSDAEDFQNRLNLPRFLSAIVRKVEQRIRTVLVEPESSIPIDDGEFWCFLKSINILYCDLTTSTSQQEASIRQALAISANGSSNVESIGDTWRQLVELASYGDKGGKDFEISDLPEGMRAKHCAIEDPRSILTPLLRHSDLVEKSIKTTIGESVYLARADVANRVTNSLNENKVVVLTAPPGTGKSALAGRIVKQLAEEHFCFSFRSEEFAKAHIDEVLIGPANWQQFEVLMGAQEKVLLHIESLERLLEHATRDAFTDFIRIALRCKNFHLLVTCRNHAVFTALNSFFGQSSPQPAVIEVPPLSDSELKEVLVSLPELKMLLNSSKLKHLLRIPFFLDIATRIDWSREEKRPNSLRAFRQLCWKEVVRRDSFTQGAMHLRRGRALIELATRRARELRPFVPSDGIDIEALEKLVNDNIVLFRDAGEIAAPAHDVLEDWAIHHWIEGLVTRHEWQASAIANSVGEYPALRRGFRNWLLEALDQDVKETGAFVIAACDNSELAPYARDDILASVLHSEAVGNFLLNHRDYILVNDAKVLIRLIHLTRVVCKQPLEQTAGRLLSSMDLVPKGKVWPNLLQVVAMNLGALVPEHSGLLIGLLEDWSRGAKQTPLPEGAIHAGEIAHRLLGKLSGYRDNDTRRRLLKTIAAVPRCNESGFLDLIKGITTEEHGNANSESFIDVLLSFVDCGSVCRDYPLQMASVVKSCYCLTDADLDRDNGFYSSLPDIEAHFGLRKRPSPSSTASAYQGPFLQLLKANPEIGTGLIIELVNHAGFWYGTQKWPVFRMERANLIKISVPGHGEVEQWANFPLWNVFRGTSVVPDLLRCALMALEAWLLQMCEVIEEAVEKLLIEILLKSNNVMTTAVVASVCNAHPDIACTAALALLTAREAIEFDRDRMVKEPEAEAMRAFPGLDPLNSIYNEERQQSNALPHRRQDLEALAVKLQWGGQSKQIWKIIDSHCALVPEVAKRSKGDRIWLLALHRMDIRCWEPSGQKGKQEYSDIEEGVEESGTLEFQISGADSDLQAFIEDSEESYQRNEDVLSLIGWGLNRWERGSGGEAPDSWASVLDKAKKLQANGENQTKETLEARGPQIVAAVCARDYWGNLGASDREWCLATLIAAVEQDSDNRDFSIQIGINPDNPDRLAAYVLPKLLSQEPGSSVLLGAVATAITHSSTQVSAFAAQGICTFIGPAQKELRLRCSGAFALFSNLQVEHLKKVDPRNSRVGFLRPKRLESSVPEKVKEAFVKGSIQVEKELHVIDLKTDQGKSAAARLLPILSECVELNLTLEFIQRVLHMIVSSWAESGEPGSSEGDLDFQFETYPWLGKALLKMQIDSALSCCQPFLAAIELHPDKVAFLLEHICRAFVSSSSETCFWSIWHVIANRILVAPWVFAETSRSTRWKSLIDTTLFAALREVERTQKGLLANHANEIDSFVARLPSNSATLEAYARYLYHFGSFALPRSFVVLKEIIQVGGRPRLSIGGNTIFCLESVLHPYVCGRPSHVKADPQLRFAILAILDFLVDAGSSASYRMRDDFVTPSSIIDG